MKKNSVMLVTAGVLSYIFAGISIALMIILGCNLFGISDLYVDFLHETVSYLIDAESQISLMCIDFLVSAMVDFYFGRFYFRANRSPFKSVQLGGAIVTTGVLQILFGSFVPGLFGVIAGVVMKKAKNKNLKPAPENLNVSDFRFTAMSEAVTRLNELRSSGAISEEEYYANLNKILEG